MKPRFTEKFLKSCSEADEFIGYPKGTTLEDAVYRLSECDVFFLGWVERDGYYSFEVDGDSVDVGPYTFSSGSMTICKRDITNWDEYYAWRITMEKLND